jgi:ubiquinone/menaquinone biosynthesis C-methylase UbiE
MTHLKKPIDPKKYTKEYFLTDCSGYDLFIKSKGSEIPERARAFHEKLLPILRPEYHVLEIGCGRGELCAALTHHVHDIIGIDYSESVIELCKDTYRRSKFENLDFMVADAKSLPFPENSFDLIICTEVLEHLHQWELEKMMNEIVRVLGNNGHFAAQTEPNKMFRYVSSIWSFLPRLLYAIIKDTQIHLLDERPIGHVKFHVNELSFWGVKKMVKNHFEKYKVETVEITLSMNNNLARFVHNGYPFNKLPYLGRFFNREIIVFCEWPIKKNENRNSFTSGTLHTSAVGAKRLTTEYPRL